MNLILLFSLCHGTLAEIKSFQYLKEAPRLPPKSQKIPIKTDENVTGRNFACNFMADSAILGHPVK